VTFKYIGEAVVLVGIAYSIVRWIARNANESDARSHVMLDVGLNRLGGSRERSHGAAGGSSATPDHSGEMLEVPPVPALPPDPEMLDGAAAMFGITREEIVRMEPRERALLLSGYRAARGAQRGSSGNGQPS
jgi:hypothetical protein